MANDDDKPMTDEELVAWLTPRSRMNTGFSDTLLSRERERTSRYYDGLEPKRAHAGSSSYVQQDVYDSVEAMKATLLETFTGNRKPVQFAPTGPNDVEEARIATNYTDFVVFRQNDGYGVFHDVIHDALMARVGIAHVYWEAREDWVEEQQGPMDPQTALLQVHQMAQSGMKTRHENVEKNKDGTVTLHYERFEDRSQVVIEAVPPEEFGISPRAKSIEDAEFVYRTAIKTKSDLLKAGFDREKIEDMWEDDAFWEEMSPEVAIRFEEVDDGNFLTDRDDMQEARRRVLVYTFFVNLDMEGTGKSDLWKVVFAGNRILDKERVSIKPFLPFVPLRKPHSFWGSGFAAKVMATQNARTVLTRSILDHAQITTNPRYTVVRGGLVNPKELLENRLGGVVNITRDGAVQPLLQASLNPFIFQTLEKLGDDKEQLTGISALSQGLNKDAISKQNSGDMVQQMVSVSQTRQKIIARNFALHFMRRLFLLVYQLVIENEKSSKVAEIAGDWVQVDPSKWRDRNDITVEFNLGYDEADKETTKWANLHTGLVGIKALQTSYGPAQQFAVACKYMDAQGIKDPETYLVNPSKLPPPKPDPLQVSLAQVPLREVAVKEGQLKLSQATAQTAAQTKQTEMGLKATREGHSVNLNGDKHDLAQQQFQLEVAKFEHDMTVDAAEIALQHQANTISATPSPHG